MLIYEIGLSTRVTNVLYRAGVRSLEALSALQVSDFARVPGLGATGLREVEAALSRHGLAPRPGGDPRHPLEEKRRVRQFTRFAPASAPESFPVQGDGDAIRAAARVGGAAGTALGDRLLVIADRLAAMLPNDEFPASPEAPAETPADAGRDAPE